MHLLALKSSSTCQLAVIRRSSCDGILTAVADAALAPPPKGTLETAGPDSIHPDELIGQVLAYDKDPRKVVMDPTSLYFGMTRRSGPAPIRVTARRVFADWHSSSSTQR